VAAAEAYIQQHGLHDVQVEVETRTLQELQEVRGRVSPLTLRTLNPENPEP
jgi:hypothetical protein